MESTREGATAREPHPAAFALVMATGIVSLAAQLHGLRGVALALFGLNGLSFCALWALMLRRLARAPRALAAELLDHARAVGFFTWPTAACVLAAQCVAVYRLPALAWVLWTLGVALAVACTYAVFVALTVERHEPGLAAGLHGGWLLAAVATQATSVASAQLSLLAPEARGALLFFALVTWLCGGVLYLWVGGLVFYRWVFLAMRPEDFQPAYWITMGAAAISALAGGLLVLRAPEVALLEQLLPVLKGGTVLAWATASWWIPLLVALGGWRHLRRGVPLRYELHSWSAVFPVGMYTACTVTLARALGLPFLAPLARVALYVALVVWALTCLGMLRALGARWRARSG